MKRGIKFMLERYLKELLAFNDPEDQKLIEEIKSVLK
jgi:hypothetical protein